MSDLKKVAYFLILLAISSASIFQVGSENSIDFQNFALRARKWYPTPEIKQFRQAIFNQNLNRIKANNQNPFRAYTMGVTIFSDMTFS